MNRTNKLTICTPCRHTGNPCQAGYDLIARLRKAIEMAGDAVAEDFAISGTACMTGCTRRCTVTYHGTRDTSYVFGDTSPEDDITALLALAEDYEQSTSDWVMDTDLSTLPAAHTLNRMPAAMLAITPTQEAVS